MDSEMLGAMLVDSIAEAVIATDLAGTVLFWNRAAEALYGWRASEVLGRNVVDVTPADTSREQAAAIMLRLGRGESWTGQFPVKRRDGSSFMAEVTDRPILDRAGALVGVVGISRDVSERYEREHLISRERTYRALFEENPRPILLWDRAAERIVDVNQAARELYGYSREEFLALRPADLRIHDHPHQGAEDTAAFLRGKTRFAAVRHRTRSGSVLDVEVDVRHVPSEGDATALVLIEDVTERLAVERSLRASEQRFATVFRRSPAMMAVRRSDGDSWLDVNDAFLAISGYTREEVVGRPSTGVELWVDAHEWQRAARLSRRQAGVRDLELRCRTKSGEALHLLYSAEVVSFGHRPHILDVFVDMTARRRLEAATNRTRMMRLGVSRALGSSTSLREASRDMLRDVGSAAGCDVGEFWLMDRGRIRQMAFWSAPGIDGPAIDRRGREMSLAPGTGLAGRAWASAEPVFVADMAADGEKLCSDEAAAAGLRQAIALPITTTEGVIGVVTFMARGIPDWTDELIPVLAELGQQIGEFVGRKRAEQALERSEQSFRSIFEGNPLPMFLWSSRTGRALSVNRAAAGLYGYSEDEFARLAYADIDASGRHPGTEALGLDRTTTGLVTGVRHRIKDGSLLDVEVTVREVDFEGQVARLMCVHDVTAQLALQRQLAHQAFHDTLTGLPNRALFFDRLHHAALRLERTPGCYAVLMLDIDNFKHVNDSLGHVAGDRLLRGVAERLAGSIRPADTAARLGGDEFGVLIEDIEDDGAAIEVAELLLEALRTPVTVGKRSVAVTATIGVATSRSRSIPATDLVRNADVALYAGKARGRGRHEIFDERMLHRAVNRATVTDGLRRAIERDQLVLHYQPLVNTWTARALGVEALVRWRHPERGLLLPASFVSLAEEMGLIADIDAHVLALACRQARAWLRSGIVSPALAVNVSGRTLKGGALLSQVRRTLEETGLSPGLLTLEITESVATDPDDRSLDALRELRALGVRIAIDDFGTGYSMLSRLQEFPIDVLKIDRSFIRGLRSASDDAPIVAGTINIARDLGLEVVAEGVETEEQRAYLALHGCPRLQGNLISRPVPARRAGGIFRGPPLIPPLEPAEPRLSVLPSAGGWLGPTPEETNGATPARGGRRRASGDAKGAARRRWSSSSANVPASGGRSATD